jgi:hypothetical protein
VSESNGSNGAKPDLEALRAEIKQTRAELGETVQALTAKADVKARAKDSVEQTKQRVKSQVAVATGKATDAVRRSRAPIAALLIGVVAAAGVVLIVRGRRR